MEEGLGVVGGGRQRLRVRLPGEGPELALHLRRAARHPTWADLQVDSCNEEFLFRLGHFIDQLIRCNIFFSRFLGFFTRPSWDWVNYFRPGRV